MNISPLRLTLILVCHWRRVLVGSAAVGPATPVLESSQEPQEQMDQASILPESFLPFFRGQEGSLDGRRKWPETQKS